MRFVLEWLKNICRGCREVVELDFTNALECLWLLWVMARVLGLDRTIVKWVCCHARYCFWGVYAPREHVMGWTVVAVVV